MNESSRNERGLGSGAIWVAIACVVALFLALYLGGVFKDDTPKPEPWAGWNALGIGVLVFVGILALAFLGYLAGWLVMNAKAKSHEAAHKQRIDDVNYERAVNQLETDAKRSQLNASRIAPDASGRKGAFVHNTQLGPVIIDLDAESTPVLLSNDGVVQRLLTDALTVAQLDALHAWRVTQAEASALTGVQTYSPNLRLDRSASAAAGQEALPAPVNWPQTVQLRDLVTGHPSLSDLTLGVTVGADGQSLPVRAAMAQMVHVAVGGSSGSGKSVFLRALALQLATSVEPCQLALIDLEAATFAPFANSNRLLWPVADTEPAALGIMAELVTEMNRRKALYAAYPGVDNLNAYNARAAEPLQPIVCLIDEATALLTDKEVHAATRTLALRARKYGVWLVLGGQAWTARELSTAIRNQLGTAVHFKAMSASQSRTLLGDGCAAALQTQGRAWARLPGQDLTEIQAPMVTPADIRTALDGQTGPTVDAPVWEVITPEDERIRELAAQGMSTTEIARQVFGSGGGAHFYRVKDVLSTTTTGPAPQA